MPQADLYPALNFSFPRLSDEEKLIILCCRTEMPEHIKAQAACLISGAFNWDFFLGLAALYRVIPFVYRHLQIFGGDIPERVRQTLREKAGLVFARNSRTLGDIEFLNGLFREGGIEALFIKGVPFMMDIYRDTGLRGFADIDILVKDFRKTEEFLRKRGFVLYDGRRISDRYRAQKMYVLGGKIYLDVHGDFIGRKLRNRIINMDKKRIWKDAREINRNGLRISTLGLSHTLLYHCMHVSIQHGFFGLIWFVDINEFIDRYGGRVNWAEVTELARTCRIRRPVYYSLLFTKRMFATPVPGAVLECLAEAERKLDAWVFNKIKENNAETDYLAELCLFDSIWDMIKFILLCFVIYPYLIVHFFLIFVKMMRAVCIRGRAVTIASSG